MLVCDPAADDLDSQLEAFFTPWAGRVARLIVEGGGEELVFSGRVPPRRDWPGPDRPCLLVAPGGTGGVHVLAPMALHLLVHNGRLVLARRRWHEEDPLDFQALGTGPVTVRLEPIAGSSA